MTLSPRHTANCVTSDMLGRISEHTYSKDSSATDELGGGCGGSSEQMLAACADGRLLEVHRLLAESSVDVSACEPRALCVASGHGHAAVVHRLLADPRVDPAAADNECIRIACASGYLAVVVRLLADPRVDPAAAEDAALLAACQHGHVAVAELLLTDSRVSPIAQDNAPIALAARSGHVAILAVLLRDPRIDHVACVGVGLAEAAAAGHVEVVDYLLALAGSLAATGAHVNAALEWAAFNGHLPALERLLADPRANPSHPEWGCNALSAAAAGGHMEVVDRLLADSRVDVAADGSAAVAAAAENGHVAALTRLLAEARVDPAAAAAEDYAAVQLASANGHVIALKCLLADARVGLAAVWGEAVVLATQNGHAEVLSCLLDVDPHRLPPEADRTECVNSALMLAIEAVDEAVAVPVVKNLASASGWTFEINVVAALSKACECGRLSIVATLADCSSHHLSDFAKALAPDGASIEDPLDHLLGLAAGRPCLQLVADKLGQNQFNAACVGDAARVQRLLAESRIALDVNCNNSYPLHIALKNYHLATDPLTSPLRDVLLVLMQDPRVDDCRGCAFAAAADEGDAGLLDALLAIPHRNPSAGLASAAGRGNMAMVHKLLSDPRCDPGFNSSAAVRAAAEFGQLEALELLLADARTDPAPLNQQAIALAAQSGSVAVLERLLADPRVDPAAMGNWPLRAAARKDCADVVRRLLADPRVDPSARNNDAIVLAARWERFETIELLLADPRVDASAGGNAALAAALAAGQTCLVARLLDAPSVCWHLLQGSDGDGTVDSVKLQQLVETLSPSDEEYCVPASLLTACLRLHSLRGWPQLRLLTSIVSTSASGIAAGAWRRRRAIVRARAVALSDDSDGIPASSSGSAHNPP